MIRENVKAFAKVNIGLKVGKKRSDGYHNIDSYFLRIPFFDELTLTLEEGEYRVEIKGNEGYLEKGKTDIMEKAARLYSEKTGKSFYLLIEIEKHIPEKAGLGGGSADAAAVFLFLNRFFKCLDKEDLVLLSKSIGADVPFFVSEEKLARVNGIGEIVTPLSYDLPYKYISLFRAQGSGVSTKDAYEKLDERKMKYSPLPSLSFPLKRESFPNDFELLEGRDMLKTISSLTSDGDYASLSGSGSVWFILSREQINTNIKEFIGSKEIM